MLTTQVYALARLEAWGEPTVILPAGELDAWAKFPPPQRQAAAMRTLRRRGPSNGSLLDDELSRFRTLATAAAQTTALNAITGARGRLLVSGQSCPRRRPGRAPERCQGRRRRGQERNAEVIR